tara:strand:+ start:224680 stop:226395 length:1716 start_codon:yes stop_codon:yes gene_type:complete
LNFEYSKYSPIVIIVSILVSLYFYNYEKRFYLWVQKYWFKKRNFKSKLKTISFVIGCVLIIISLLDLRGASENIESNIPVQKTIIIIDSSSSMLAEDVKPSRFKKSLMLARHFVKSAVGHSISVVLFSDTQKKLVPFTDDIDLLDSRIESLESISIQNGGSNITQAIMESIQYFKMDMPDEEIYGNVLLLTDSEETEESLNLDIPANVNVAAIGIGTLAGGKIPIRDRYNYFRGFKKFGGKEVVSKLDENFLKKLGSKINSYKYWVVQSYNLPTEEILEFFKSKFIKSLQKSKAVVKPVLNHYVVIPGIFFLTISYMLSMTSPFLTSLLILGFLIISPQKVLGSEIDQRIKNGEASFEEKLKYSENLLKAKEFRKSQLFMEDLLKKSKDYRLYNNLGIANLRQKKFKEAIDSFENAFRVAEDERVKKEIRENILKVLAEKDKDKKDKDKENKDKKNKDKKDNSKSKGNKKDKKDKSDKQNKEKSKGDNKDGKKDDKDKDKGDKEDKNKDQDKKEKTPQDELEKRESEIKRKRKLQKIPALVKQLMSEDRELQKKFLDTSTSERKGYDKKDW